MINGTYADAPTGLAVQKRGQLLFIAHGFKNQIRGFDKLTGELVFNASVSQPASIAVTRDDASVWVVAQDGSTVSKHAVSPSGLTHELTLPSGAVGRAGAIAISPQNELLVADLSSYQLRLFSSTGTLLRSYGIAGGYHVSREPTVRHDRFWWTTPDFGVGSDRGTTLAYEADGTFWVGDPGNRRMLHLASNGTYIGQLMYMPRVYRSAVPSRSPSRVFVNFLEFSIDYTQPVAASWTLVRNWGAGLPMPYVAWDAAMGVAAAMPLGRVPWYCKVTNGDRPIPVFRILGRSSGVQ